MTPPSPERSTEVEGIFLVYSKNRGVGCEAAERRCVLNSRTAVAFGHRPRGGDAADMKCTQGRRTLYAPHGLAWVTYRLSVTPIGGGVDPLARRSPRLDGQEYCQVTTREAE